MSGISCHCAAAQGCSAGRRTHLSGTTALWEEGAHALHHGIGPTTECTPRISTPASYGIVASGESRTRSTASGLHPPLGRGPASWAGISNPSRFDYVDLALGTSAWRNGGARASPSGPRHSRDGLALLPSAGETSRTSRPGRQDRQWSKTSSSHDIDAGRCPRRPGPRWELLREALTGGTFALVSG